MDDNGLHDNGFFSEVWGAAALIYMKDVLNFALALARFRVYSLEAPICSATSAIHGNTMAPLQIGSCVILRKKDWRHVVGIIQAAVGKDEFMVQNHLSSNATELVSTRKASSCGNPPDSSASSPTSSPVSLNDAGSEDPEDTNSAVSVTPIASLSAELIVKSRAAQQEQNGNSSGRNDEDFWDIDSEEILDEEVWLQCIEHEEEQPVVIPNTKPKSQKPMIKQQHIGRRFSITVKLGGENSNGQSFE